METGSVNFHLLECLQMVVQEMHVTRAANKLGMSQPKLSAALARLRVITGDPLLVRTPAGMVATDLAIQLTSEVTDFLSSWSRLVSNKQEFSPANSQHIFRIQTSDFIIQEALADACHEVRGSAPNISLSVSPLSLDTMQEKLATGETDLAIGGITQLPQDLFVTHLFTTQLCCIAAADHPRIGSHLNLETYVQERHAIATFGSPKQLLLTEKLVDSALAHHDVERKAAFYLTSLLAIIGVVARTDLLAVLPTELVRNAPDHFKLKCLKPPFELPDQQIVMVWHARTNRDPANKWLRNVLRHAVKSRASVPPAEQS